MKHEIMVEYSADREYTTINVVTRVVSSCIETWKCECTCGWYREYKDRDKFVKKVNEHSRKN